MIEIKPMVSKAPHSYEPFPCFIRGCHEPAKHLAKISHGEAIVQVCLCNDCQRKTAQAILEGLTGVPFSIDWRKN